MVIMRYSWIFIICILSFSAMAISCDEDSSKTTTHPANTVTKSGLAHTEKKNQLNYKDFSVFYSAFSSAVDRSDWEYLAKLTRFPFLLRGELDAEGQVVFNKDGFIKAIGKLFNEEIYINVNDELVATNYRKVIFNAKKKQQYVDEDAQLFGIQFRNKNDGWKLSEITTHAHIIEKFSE